MSNLILKGNIVYSTGAEELKIMEDHYLVCEDGIVKGVYENVPVEYQGINVKDCGNKIIMPGLSDLHVHAPQYTYRGMGMDMELLDWLNTYTFPEEGKYTDIAYAKKAYTEFVNDLKKSGTTRVCVFGTIHNEATKLLMDLLEESGIHGYVGKVSMNRNAPEFLCEEDGAQAVIQWLDSIEGRYQNIQPIITPRFTPSCTDELMKELGDIQKANDYPLQSHLSENEGEIAWVQELCPESKFYGDAYDRLGAFGSNGKTVMAHCVHSGLEERQLMKERGVYVAHCPESNTNLSSGIAPVRQYLEEGVCIGLGSDIAGGHELSMFRVMKAAIQVSKLRWRLMDQGQKPLTVEEAFYLGTKAGGSFFGQVGSFEAGYEMDALVLDDSNLNPTLDLSVKDRLERLIYSAQDSNIEAIYVAGIRIDEKKA